MRMLLAVAVTAAGCLSLPSRMVLAKGLDELEDQNPEEQSDDADAEKGHKAKAHADDDDDDADEQQSGEEEKTLPKSAASKAIAQKLFLATSVGWVKASRSTGTWNASGMTDVTVGYKLLSMGSKMGLAGTFRYAPIAVSGTEDDKSYRGVWEGYYVGGRLNVLLAPSINVIASAEVGAVSVHMDDVDGLTANSDASKSGGQVVVGGGADFMISEKWAFSVGPRLYAGVGSFTTFQLAVATGFLF